MSIWIWKINHPRENVQTGSNSQKYKLGCAQHRGSRLWKSKLATSTRKRRNSLEKWTFSTKVNDFQIFFQYFRPKLKYKKKNFHKKKILNKSLGRKKITIFSSQIARNKNDLFSSQTNFKIKKNQFIWNSNILAISDLESFLGRFLKWIKYFLKYFRPKPLGIKNKI